MIDKILFILLAFFWGGSFLAIQNTIEVIPSFTSAFYRVFLSTIFLIIFFIKDFLKLFQVDRGEIISSALTGLCAVGIPFGLLFWGEKYVSPSIAAVINGTVPLWTLFLSALLFHEKNVFTKNKILGVILGIVGIIFIFYPKLNFNNQTNEVFGLIAIVFMAISYAVGINLNRKIQSTNKHLSNKQNLIIQQLFSSVFLLFCLILIEGPPNFELLLSTKVSLSVLYLGLFSTAIAFTIFYRLIRTMGSVKASSVTYFVPAVALFLDTLIFDRKLGSYEYFGSAIIFLSLYFIQKKN